MKTSSPIYSSIAELSISEHIHKDKAQRLLNLIYTLESAPISGQANVYLMIRPRGFGLSLLSGSIEDLYNLDPDMLKKFENKEDVLENLKPRHCINLSFKGFSARNLKEFNNQLINFIQELYWKYHIPNSLNLYSTPKAYFSQLIDEIYNRYQEPVALMINNYDSPLLAACLMKDQSLCAESTSIYLDLLNVIKYSEKKLAWCLLTGHIKFNLASEFSEGLPLIQDISTDPSFDSLFGFTKDEVSEIYKEEIEKLAKESEISFDDYVDNLEKCYGGFCFSDTLTKVMCPTSTTRAIKNQGLFYPYSGYGSYQLLTKVLLDKEDNLDWLFNKDGQDPLFANSVDYHFKKKQIGTLMLQLGFATRDKVTINESEGFTTWRYRFVCPNLDMKKTYENIINKSSSELELLDLSEDTTFEELEET